MPISKQNQTPRKTLPSSQTATAKLAKLAGRFTIEESGRTQELTIGRARSAFSMQKSGLADLRRQFRASRLARSQAMAEREVQRRFNAREREVDRGIKAYWAKLKGKVRVRPSKSRATRRSAPLRLRNVRLSGFIALPRYSGVILDRQGRRGIYMAVEYFGARRTRPGAARRWVVYITREDGVERDGAGEAVIVSNIGETAEEQAMAFELVEVINRAARANGKLFFSMIINLPHDIPVEARREIVRRFCEESFGAYDLPFCAALHEPSADGDQRNKHAHILFALRPLRRTGDHEWEAGRELLTEHDNPERFLELRKRFAEIMTEVVQDHGKLGRAYTHLSNAKRGLKGEPQTHLGAAGTAMVRKGEEVRANARNIERVVQGERNMRVDLAIIERQAREAGRIERRRHVALSPLPLAPPPTILAMPLATRQLPIAFEKRRLAVRTALPATRNLAAVDKARTPMPALVPRFEAVRYKPLPSTMALRPKLATSTALPLSRFQWAEPKASWKPAELPVISLSVKAPQVASEALPAIRPRSEQALYLQNLDRIWRHLRELAALKGKRRQPHRGFPPPDQDRSL